MGLYSKLVLVMLVASLQTTLANPIERIVEHKHVGSVEYSMYIGKDSNSSDSTVTEETPALQVPPTDASANKNHILEDFKSVQLDSYSQSTSKRSWSPRPVRSASKLKNIFQQAFRKPGLKGKILYTARRVMHVKFIDARLLRSVAMLSEDNAGSTDTVVLAQLQIYQRPSAGGRRRYKRRQVKQARVNVYQTMGEARHRLPAIKLLDSRLVRIDSVGWLGFDVTSAVRDWLTDGWSNRGFQVWVESVRGGKRAANTARRIKFVQPKSRRFSSNKPALILYTKHRKEKL